MQGSLTTHGRSSKKSHGRSTQLFYSLTRANNYQQWKLDPFLRARKKISECGSGKKKREEVPRKFKNERSAYQMMLMAFWDCYGLVYAEFGPDACKEKRNVTQDKYFNSLMHLRNVIWSKRQGLLNQEVILIHDNAHPHRVHMIQILLKGFHGNCSNTLRTHQT